jgi:sterol desaturase/sphingolipid hydroxylase (fatty acid hydroxylase superfamily)
MAMIFADLCFYWMHRTFHKVPWMWKFHAVHHSIEELDWLASYRIHAVDQILTKGASLIPVFGFGFSDATIAIFAVIYQWQTLMEHANVNISYGPLRWLVASPQFHHWHHANERQAYDKNFAAQFSFLDWIFGTAYLPGNEFPDRYGTNEPVPKEYVGQFYYPFGVRRPDANARPDPKPTSR